MGCPLLESSPMTWTTTPSLRVAWASTCRIFVWHSLNCRDITFLCISYRWGKKMLLNIFIIPILSQIIHEQMTNKTYSLPIDCFWKLSIRIQSTMDIGWVSSIKSELCKFWTIFIFQMKMPWNIMWWNHEFMEHTCAESLALCWEVCNTVSQTPALPAGDWASPSPFLC